jgi:hypothetical protein
LYGDYVPFCIKCRGERGENVGEKKLVVVEEEEKERRADLNRILGVALSNR